MWASFSQSSHPEAHGPCAGPGFDSTSPCDARHAPLPRGGGSAGIMDGGERGLRLLPRGPVAIVQPSLTEEEVTEGSHTSGGVGRALWQGGAGESGTRRGHG